MKKMIAFLIGMSTLVAQAAPTQDEIIKNMHKTIQKCAESTGAKYHTPLNSEVGENYQACVLELGNEEKEVADFAFILAGKDIPKQRALEITAFAAAQGSLKYRPTTVAYFNQNAIEYLFELLEFKNEKK